MWNRESSRGPVAAFAIPPHAPEAVAAAYEAFDRLGDEWGRLKVGIRDLREQVAAAKETDIRAVADAEASGEPFEDANEHEKWAQAALEAAEGRLPGLQVALDEAGNQLADAIAENRSEWLDRLAEVRDQAASEYQTALAAALDAIKRFTPAMGAVEWLEGFRANVAHNGKEFQFAGGSVKVRREQWDLDGNASHVDPSQLIELARKATKSEEEQIELARKAARTS